MTNEAEERYVGWSEADAKRILAHEYKRGQKDGRRATVERIRAAGDAKIVDIWEGAGPIPAIDADDFHAILDAEAER